MEERMADVKWTKEQSQAIHEKESNILVAAGAGSGKTAVLVERIINKIIREKYSNIEANWSKNVIEITGKGSGKALTLEKLCEDFNINKDDIYVIGDSGNDISMFKTFHEHSFCMSHAPENVKKYAKYTLENSY